MQILHRIFRIEHCKSKVGPYRHRENDDLFNMALKHSNKENSSVTPSILDDYPLNSVIKNESKFNFYKELCLIPFSLNRPVIDCVLFIESKKIKNCLFGFSTIRQLRNWFTDDELELLHKSGFNLVVYETPLNNVLSFKKQILIMNKDNLNICWKQNIISLIKDISNEIS